MPGWNVEQKENSSPALMDLEIASCQAFHPSSLPFRPRVLQAASVQAVGLAHWLHRFFPNLSIEVYAPPYRAHRLKSWLSPSLYGVSQVSPPRLKGRQIGGGRGVKGASLN